jgi:hypothetical protein
LAMPNLSLAYIKANLMGSTGKQADSGDIDIAIDDSIFTMQDMQYINSFVRKYFGDQYANSKGMAGGQLNTAWPIAGDKANGYVQIDFILGDPTWLKFSHHSPGLDVSPYKGVWISTMLGVLAKFKKDYEKMDPEGNQISRVGLAYDLEKGLQRKWKLQKVKNQGASEVSADEWESKAPSPVERFARIGYLTNPDDVVRILLGDDVKPSDVDTFEKLWEVIKQKSKAGRLPPIAEIKDRFADALLRSGDKKNYKTKEDILATPVFQ